MKTIKERVKGDMEGAIESAVAKLHKIEPNAKDLFVREAHPYTSTGFSGWAVTIEFNNGEVENSEEVEIPMWVSRPTEEYVEEGKKQGGDLDFFPE